MDTSEEFVISQQKYGAHYNKTKGLPKSFPKPDCLNPPKGAATSVLLYVLTKHVPASNPSATRSALKWKENMSKNYQTINYCLSVYLCYM